MDKKSNTSPVDQPLMSTGSTDSGFDWDTDGAKLNTKPVIGDQKAGERAVKNNPAK